MVLLTEISAVIASPVTPGHEGSALEVEEGPGATILSWILIGIGAAALVFAVSWLRRHARSIGVDRWRIAQSFPVFLVLILTYFIALPIVGQAILGASEPNQEAGFVEQMNRGFWFSVFSLMVVPVWFFVSRSRWNEEWLAVMRRQGGEESKPAAQPEKEIGICRSIVMAVGMLAVTWPIMILAGNVSRWVSEAIRGEPENPLAHKTLELLADASFGDLWPWLTITSVIVIAPIVEEVIYRGCLQGALRSLTRSPWPALVLSSLAFSAMHFSAASLVALPGLFILGLSLGLAYERSGRLAVPIVMHMLFNAGNVALLFALRAIEPS